MASFPTGVTQVDVFLYTPGVPMPHLVYSGGNGTYTVGTLLTSVFYNLDLKGGKDVAGGPHPGATYRFQGRDTKGNVVQMHWMTCLTGGSSPTFGLTQRVGSDRSVTHASSYGLHSPYIEIAPMHDVKVELDSGGMTIAIVEIPCSGKGELIATRIGTPHLMGVRVEGIDSNLVHVGVKGFIVSGTVDAKNKADYPVGYSNMVCASVDGTTAVFLTQFP